MCRFETHPMKLKFPELFCHLVVKLLLKKTQNDSSQLHKFKVTMGQIYVYYKSCCDGPYTTEPPGDITSVLLITYNHLFINNSEDNTVFPITFIVKKKEKKEKKAQVKPIPTRDNKFIASQLFCQ